MDIRNNGGGSFPAGEQASRPATHWPPLLVFKTSETLRSFGDLQNTPTRRNNMRACCIRMNFHAPQVAKMWLDQGDIVLIADSDGVRYRNAIHFVPCCSS